MLIAEEYLLLALDETTGKLRVGSDVLGPALGGALVVELALRERIGVTPHDAGWNKRGRVTITSVTPTDDPELDAALAKLAENEGRKVKDLLSEYSTKKRRLSHGVRERLLERLAASGAVVRTEGTILGFIPRTTWPAGDPADEEDVRRRLQAALVEGTTPTERTVALIALLQVTGLLPKVVTTQDKKALKTKAKELTSGDWAAKAVKDAIDEAAAATAGAAAGAAGAAAGGS
jgi:Golgi phosphoprotein 3 (GPP34)